MCIFVMRNRTSASTFDGSRQDYRFAGYLKPLRWILLLNGPPRLWAQITTNVRMFVCELNPLFERASGLAWLIRSGEFLQRPIMARLQGRQTGPSEAHHPLETRWTPNHAAARDCCCCPRSR